MVPYALLLEVKQAVSTQGKEAALPKGRKFLVNFKMSFLVSSQIFLIFHFRLRIEKKQMDDQLNKQQAMSMRERTKTWNWKNWKSGVSQAT